MLINVRTVMSSYCVGYMYVILTGIRTAVEAQAVCFTNKITSLALLGDRNEWRENRGRVYKKLELS